MCVRIRGYPKRPLAPLKLKTQEVLSSKAQVLETKLESLEEMGFSPRVATIPQP